MPLQQSSVQPDPPRSVLKQTLSRTNLPRTDLLAGPSSPSRRRSPFGFASASSSSAGGAADPVALAEQLLRGFKPLMQAGTRPVAQIQDLLQAMAASPLDKIKYVGVPGCGCRGWILEIW